MRSWPRRLIAVLIIGWLAAANDASAQPARQLLLPDQALAALPALRAGQTMPAPLIVLLHGAGQTPADMINRFAADPACRDAVLLAPKSLDTTWDVVRLAQRKALDRAAGSDTALPFATSPDAERVMAAITALSAQVQTDPARQMLLGFSDGASFALALGTARNRPFTAVVALAPGLNVVAGKPARGRPVLVMHGLQDRALPIEFTRTTIVPTLRSARLAVSFVPFAGGHEIPADALAEFDSAYPLLGLR